CARAQDLPLLDHPPVAAVRCAAGGPLCEPLAMVCRRPFMLFTLAAMLLAGCDKLGISPPSGQAFKGVDITGADYKYALPDQNGQMRTPADFTGKVTAVFFGYTQCPDVCPTTLAESAQMKKSPG